MTLRSTSSRPNSPVVLDDRVCRLSGDWNAQALAVSGEVYRRVAQLARARSAANWDLTGIAKFDAVGAQLLWKRWGAVLPQGIALTDSQRALFDVLAEYPVEQAPAAPAPQLFDWVRRIGHGVFVGLEHGLGLLRMLGALFWDLGRLLMRPSRGPWREISAQVYRVGAQALGITALVGFLIGMVLSYLSAQQLAVFGAGQFIVKLLGVATVRELGPILAAILVAGRSGSSITAQIGAMRVTQELDAMEVMGISHGQRLILPRVIALAIAMPLLVLWTDAIALIGGMVVAKLELDLTMQWFFGQLPDAIGIKNYWISIIKGTTFGAWIALVACHFGFRIKPNTESLGRGTTASVVTAITGVILIDALYAMLFDEMGI
jgi:phospholipid/cholesterol/gamma-HCH transport system permease protein